MKIAKWSFKSGVLADAGRARWTALMAAGALLLATAAAQAAAPGTDAAKAAQAPAKKGKVAIEAVVEPKAIEILKAASARLAGARAMKFTATIAYEAPSLYGPALVYTTRSDVTLQRPNKLKVVTPGDGPASEFYFDGKVMMAYSPAANLVAVGDAPPTIDDTLEYAFHAAEIYFPFTDLVVTDPWAGIVRKLQIAFYIGQSKVVGGTTTDIVAYASDDVFVQIWIGAEDKLPRKVRAVYGQDPLGLRHDMELSNWQLDPKVAPEEFATAHTAAAKRIAFGRPSQMQLPKTKAPAGAKSPIPKPSKSQ